MREISSSDDINERKGSLILKHRDTGQPRNYGFVVIILQTPTFLSFAHNENVCNAKNFKFRIYFCFILDFISSRGQNPVSSQPLLVRRKYVPLLSLASLLCCCCVIKTYRWKAVHLLPSPVQPSNSWIFFSVLTLFFNKGHCDSSEFQRQQTHKLLYNLLIQNKSILLIA